MKTEDEIAEEELTETVFNALGAVGSYEIEFGDEGNTIFATGKNTNEHFTITIKKDKE